tara:strand:+ start:606 stop:917 length:312 start_codon:yes stop_codon:yes gene_type:complete
VLRVSEVYEKQVRNFKERPDGSEYVAFEKVFATRESLINKNYIVSVHPHEFTTDAGVSKMESAFPEGTKFSVLVLDGNSFRKSELIVVGSFDKLCQSLEEHKK